MKQNTKPDVDVPKPECSVDSDCSIGGKCVNNKCEYHPVHLPSLKPTNCAPGWTGPTCNIPPSS